MAASPRTSRDLTLFRAPPPSPAAITRNTSPETHEDDDFSRFLKRSRRIPELILPHRNPPEIDLGSLISPERELSEKDNLRSAARSMGCFQIINHGIKQRVIQAAVETAEVVFKVPLERKKEAARSPERKWGFEVEEEDDVAESDEFFWWSGDAEEMAGVLAPEYDAFR
ncbi:flavanone 3-dioxygenase 3-like [Dendrobium catenatum]|nr:flavanone 3-dioxygenase 3-like [Dendrobium catenatum]